MLKGVLLQKNKTTTQGAMFTSTNKVAETAVKISSIHLK
jgi:hypothetical protein